MNKDEVLEKIGVLLRKCDEFYSVLADNAIWSVNDGVDAPDYIETDNKDWRLFVIEYQSLNEILMDCVDCCQLTELINTVPRIHQKTLDDICVELTKLKHKIEKVATIVSETSHSSLEILFDDMSKLREHFTFPLKVPGMPSPSTIYKNQYFLEWRSKMISELHSNKDPLARNTVKELGNFNGWSDEKLFNNIQAELTVLISNERKKGVSGMQSNNKKVFIVHGDFVNNT